MAEPKLRFKQKDGGNYPSWKEVPLGTLVSDNLDPVPTPKEGYRRVGIYCHAKGTFQEDVPAENVLDVDTMYRIHKDNLIVNITFAWEHAVAIVKPEDEGLLVSHRFPEYSINDGQIPGFYKYLILRPYFKNQLSLASPGGAGRNRVLNKAEFKKILVHIPCEEEQKKIADFLSSVDDVIRRSEEEVANLEKQKKAVMKKVFSQEVHFKKNDGTEFPEWEEHPLNFYLTENKKRNKDRHYSKENVLSVSKDYGVVNQIQFFGKSLAGEDLSNYHCVDCGDVIYTKSPLGKQPYGIIKASKQAGIVSTLYAVYHCTDKVLPEFIDYYFSRDVVLNNYLKPLVNIGAKHDMKVRNDVAISGLVRFPSSIDEQRLIADFLSNFDEAIAAAKKELELWKQFKKGLLQQMFV